MEINDQLVSSSHIHGSDCNACLNFAYLVAMDVLASVADIEEGGKVGIIQEVLSEWGIDAGEFAKFRAGLKAGNLPRDEIILPRP